MTCGERGRYLYLCLQILCSSPWTVEFVGIGGQSIR